MVERNNPHISLLEQTSYTSQNDDVSKETNVTRGEFGIAALAEVVFPRFSRDSVNMLVVGLGSAASGGIVSQYEPYNLAAYAEAHNRGYSLSLVDVDQESIEAFLQRETLFHQRTTRADNLNYNDSDDKFLEAWKNYLTLTHQKTRVIFDTHPDLVFNEYLQRDSKFMERLLATGYYQAGIPRGLAKKLKKREVSALIGDIAVADLNNIPHLPFHLVSLMNVLIYLPITGQKLALDNVSRSTTEGGIIVVNDYGVIMPWMESLFKKRHHGWLTEEMLAGFNLKIADKRTQGENHFVYFLEKTPG